MPQVCKVLHMRCRYRKIDYANRSCSPCLYYVYTYLQIPLHSIYSNPGRLLIPHDRLQRVCAARWTPMIFITIFPCTHPLFPRVSADIQVYTYLIYIFSAFFRYILSQVYLYIIFIHILYYYVRFFKPTREERKKNLTPVKREERPPFNLF